MSSRRTVTPGAGRQVSKVAAEGQEVRRARNARAPEEGEARAGTGRQDTGFALSVKERQAASKSYGKNEGKERSG